MEENVLIGLSYVLMAGIFAGFFSFPMKFTASWKWHHNWVIFAIWVLFIMLIIIVSYFIPDLPHVYWGIEIIVGSMIILGDIILCFIAESKRSKAVGVCKLPSFGSNKAIFFKGLVIAILAALLSTMQNVGFIAGNPIQDTAVSFGENPLNEGNATWSILMIGCQTINVVFCVYLITKYKEWNLFDQSKQSNSNLPWKIKKPNVYIPLMH